jgi:hypothetical protein
MAANGPNRLIEAAREIQDFCEARHWPYCFIGGIAVQHWGEARLTRDADLVVFTGVGDEARYVDELLAHFPARIDRAREFALRHRVLLLRATNGVPLDLSFGALEFEEQAVMGANLEEIVPGVRLRLASPSALVVFKAFADRPQDWIDLEGVIAKSGTRIDWGTVDAQLGILLDLKGDRSALDRLAQLRAKLTNR